MRYKILLPSLILLFACVLGLVIVSGAGYLLFNSRSQPSEGDQLLFPGSQYNKETRFSPRLMVIHVVKINLRQEGISLLITPGDPEKDLPMKARTTSRFLDEYNLQLAVNGDGFTPSHSNSFLDYYPHPGDPVDPIGFAASRGVSYSDYTDEEPVLFISKDNRARFNSPIGGIYNALSGNLMLLRRGEVQPGLNSEVEPRTAVALDKRARHLIIVVVDGRQPGYSEGATLAELADILITLGGYEAMNLDGGGSSTLVKADQNGNPVLLNSPIDHGFPGKERPVANHLGVVYQTDDQ